MKSKMMILSTTLSIVIASISCSSFGATPTQQATPRPVKPAGPLKFEPESLPPAQKDVMYEAEIHITQNITPVGDISISKGALPAGLELVKAAHEDTAKISGIPQEKGSFTFTVFVWCFGTMVSGQAGQKEYEIVVGE